MNQHTVPTGAERQTPEVEANTISYNEPADRSNGSGEADTKGAKVKANTERFAFR